VCIPYHLPTKASQLKCAHEPPSYNLYISECLLQWKKTTTCKKRFFLDLGSGRNCHLVWSTDESHAYLRSHIRYVYIKHKTRDSIIDVVSYLVHPTLSVDLWDLLSVYWREVQTPCTCVCNYVTLMQIFPHQSFTKTTVCRKYMNIYQK